MQYRDYIHGVEKSFLPYAEQIPDYSLFPQKTGCIVRDAGAD
jgi:hypothetical protein